MKGWFEAAEEDDLEILSVELEDLDGDEIDLREAAFMKGYREDAEA